LLCRLYNQPTYPAYY